ncbi:hypothetical protein D9756_008758 [Leucocoprinus leucothites]|uniref:Uncharacterized protein n=1 Tax=Leucocoprinus leucothites TaxID=201217 RepID=A0A8H5FVW3_9AGAR|nr:hypothetical protein D9756_008758 [Leucoagaricus leucothites]
MNDFDVLRMDAGAIRKSAYSIASRNPSTIGLMGPSYSVHLIRNSAGSTIISYHPTSPLPRTMARDLHTRLQLIGRSAYWQKMISATSDPTFLLLTFLWHALYAWDEALENLYSHICSLEMAIIGEATQTSLVDELHILRAHQLHYSSLLESFKETVEFIRETPYPALQAVNTEERTMSELMMERECKLLLNEISRLNRSQKMQGKRLKNAINLVFSHIAIVDSRKTSVMTEVSVRDSSDEANRISDNGLSPGHFRRRMLFVKLCLLYTNLYTEN